jgi:hypothetical protein
MPLTDEPAPYLPLSGWRNPLEPAGIEATLSGAIVVKIAERYLAFFAKLGVKPAANGGNISKPGAARRRPERDA